MPQTRSTHCCLTACPADSYLLRNAATGQVRARLTGHTGRGVNTVAVARTAERMTCADLPRSRHSTRTLRLALIHG